MSLEVIEFVDTTTFSPWSLIDEAAYYVCKVCVARGEVVYEDAKQVTIALITDKDMTSCSDRAVIPKGVIVSRKEVVDG